MRGSMIMPLMLFTLTTVAPAQVAVGISLPGVSIGINQPAYPDLVLVPGYPVYYAPGSPLNYFFYDGLYWVYQNDEWYSSEWFNGPWTLTDPYSVPLFLLRVPVRYYRQPPPYFAGWDRDAPPRWGEHWGGNWEQRRHGWDHWDRRAARLLRPCRSTSADSPGAAIPASPSSSNCTPRTTTTSRGKRWSGNATGSSPPVPPPLRPRTATRESPRRMAAGRNPCHASSRRPSDLGPNRRHPCRIMRSSTRIRTRISAGRLRKNLRGADDPPGTGSIRELEGAAGNQEYRKHATWWPGSTSLTGGLDSRQWSIRFQQRS